MPSRIEREQYFMTRERWEQIENIYHRAIELDGDKRAAFLADMCGDDDDLTAEIDSLLNESDKADSFLCEPLVSTGLALVNEQRQQYPPGQRLNGYLIKRLLARGGMGDVYLAEDTRLQRQVALKLLQDPELTPTADTARRFEREARAASIISHPNVAHIYDVGEFEGSSFIAMEYVEGVSLRSLLKGEKLSSTRVTDIARQVADGLAAAHAVGIIHRDIKPENIMLRDDRLVKIVDFGLAKVDTRQLSYFTGTAEAGTQNTLPGAIMGTVGYMSPEQVRGKEIDARTDIWSLGVVLYEMFAGQRPFHGDSNVDTLSSILKEEPDLLDGPGLNIHPVAERIVRRCLEKNPADRFQTAADLSFALSSVGNDSRSSARYGPMEKAGRERVRLLPLALVSAVVLACFAGAYLIFAGPGFFKGAIVSQPVYRQMTFERGTVWSGRFSPGGNELVYEAGWNQKATDLYSLTPPNTESRKLTLPNTTLLSVSSQGEMAILLNHQYLYQFINRGTLARVSISGGAVREVADDVQEADWAPDSENMAIVRWSGAENKLEYPIGTLLYQVNGYLSCPRVSPTGEQVAFFEHASQWDNRGDVSVIGRDGDRQVVSAGWGGLEGLAWHDGEIWFTGSRTGEAYALYSVVPGEKERLVASVPVNLMLHDISSTGRVLLSRAIQQTDIYLNRENMPDYDLSWLHLIGPADLAADGSAFIFTHFGEGSGVNYSVYLRKTDGSPAVRLGEGRAMALSPDGRLAIAKLNEPQSLVLLQTGAGKTITLPRGNIDRFDRAGWFPDGQSIIFTGSEPGKPKRSFVQKLSSGEITPLTPEGYAGTKLSPGGKFLIVTSVEGQKMIFPVNGREAVPIKGLVEGEEIVSWGPDDSTLLVYGPLELPIRIFRLNINTGRRDLVRAITPANEAGVFGNIYLFATPDAKMVVYGLRRYLFDLYMVDGLK